VSRLDELLLEAGERLLASRAGAMLVRGAHGALARIAPHVPQRVEIPPERAAACVRVEVRPSGIPGAGLGLYAAEPVGAGVVIGEYAGDVVGSILKVLRLRSLAYVALDEQYIDTSRHPEVAMRYVCHHPRPERRNVDFDGEGGRLFLRTTRPVEPGEEFFVDYGAMYWAVHGVEPASD
jgi:hypothetical protein